jgi:hypothetical protein
MMSSIIPLTTTQALWLTVITIIFFLDYTGSLLEVPGRNLGGIINFNEPLSCHSSN